jgi:enamidase
LKVHGGAVVLQKGLTEKDFEEMAHEGVWLIAEIGGGGIWRPEEVKDMVSWARKYGFKISVHCGGESIPGSATVTANDVIAINPDIVAHTNGGCTAASLDDVKKLVNETDYYLEVIYNGNPLMMSNIVELLREKGDLHRLILGSDTPIGIGAIPAAIIRTIVQISSLNKVPGDQAIAFGTGNTATAYGLNTGMVEEGREADLLVMDYNPGSVSNNAIKSLEIGDTPGVTMIMINGQVIAYRGRNTPKGVRSVIVDGQEKKIASHADYLFSSQKA